MLYQIPIAIVIIAYINTSSAKSSDYCEIPSCNPPYLHTMCQFSEPEPAASCLAVEDLGGGLTDNEIKRIVNLHNKYRRLVASGKERRGAPGPQPAAASMPDLVWDKELAEVAQRWADQCNWGHDQCRNVDRFRVGQNIAIMGTTDDVSTIDIVKMVDSWYNEVKHYNREAVSRFRSGRGAGGAQTGHYTQMVWAKTTRIGCGARKYSDGEFNQNYLVCNYGPAGNIIGRPVYNKKSSNKRQG